MADGVWKGVQSQVIGRSDQLAQNKFFDPSTPSMRKGRGGGNKEEKKKKLTATDCNAAAHANLVLKSLKNLVETGDMLSKDKKCKEI